MAISERVPQYSCVSTGHVRAKTDLNGSIPAIASIIHKLREVEVMSAHGKTVAEVSRQHGVTDQTCFR